MDTDEKEDMRDAITAGDLGKVKALIGNSVERRDEHTYLHGSWLHMAANRGQLPVVKWLVEAGADINRQAGAGGGSALEAAARKGHLEVVRYLLSRGAEMDVRESHWNPLFGAIVNGHLDVVKLLLEHGIDPKAKYPGEFMPKMDANAYSFALEQGQRQIADYIQKWMSEH